MYSFLAQIYANGNTNIEKRFIFYKRLLPLLEFGREGEGIDLSKVVLTHLTPEVFVFAGSDQVNRLKRRGKCL